MSIFGAIVIYMTLTLNVEKRDIKGKTLSALRKEGKIPAIVYGRKEESTPISVDTGVFEKTLKEAGESSILVLEGLDDNKEVLVQDVVLDPQKGKIVHIDFYAIERGKELTTEVPLEFVGESPAVKIGGILNKSLHEVEVTCRPSALPKHIEVDVSSLTNFEEAIHIKDLKLPSGVKVENDPEDVVVVVMEARKEEEPAETTVDMSQIEVEGKEKSEEGE